MQMKMNFPHIPPLKVAHSNQLSLTHFGPQDLLFLPILQHSFWPTKMQRHGRNVVFGFVKESLTLRRALSMI